VTSTEARLDQIRGAVAPRNHNARTIAALTSNPGCARRAVMDAAGVDKQRLASHAGFPAPFGQSRFAITRGNAFEAQVKANGCAELLRLLREQLALPIPEVSYDDLEEVGGNTSAELRHARTRRLLARAAASGADAGTLFDHPLLRLEVAGRQAYLEPDLIAFQLYGQFRVVEMKSFAVIDGQADGEKVAAAAIQSAVYVLALRELLAGLGYGPEKVSHDAVLVCAENFSNAPVATLLDVRKQLTVLRRQLSRLEHASTGWETLLEGTLKTGWAVTATWPMRTERGGRTRDINSNALASSIVLACRPRPPDAKVTDRRGLIAALREELPGALRKLQQGSVAPVDLPQAAIGPGMAVFSHYARVNEPDGSAMRVRPALALINQVLDEVLSQQEGDFGADTRWCLEWFKSYGFEPGPYGMAETLSKAKNTAVAGLERAGVLKSGGGKVRLLAVGDLAADYDPTQDDRVSEWEILLHLAKHLREQGADAAAQLMAASRLVVDLDAVRELAYLLFSVAEKRGWAEIALLFNGLGTSWSDLAEASRKQPAAGAHVQGQLGFDADEG